MSRGWHGQSYRHYLASKGYSTRYNAVKRSDESLALALLEAEERVSSRPGTLESSRASQIHADVRKSLAKQLEQPVPESRAERFAEEGISLPKVRVKLKDEPIWPWKSDDALKLRFDYEEPVYDEGEDWVARSQRLADQTLTGIRTGVAKGKELKTFMGAFESPEKLAMREARLGRQLTSVGRDYEGALSSSDLVAVQNRRELMKRASRLVAQKRALERQKQLVAERLGARSDLSDVQADREREALALHERLVNR